MNKKQKLISYNELMSAREKGWAGRVNGERSGLPVPE